MVRAASTKGDYKQLGSVADWDTVFNCKEFGHFAKECKKPKRVKDYSYHKEKMLLWKQAEKGVPLQAEYNTMLNIMCLPMKDSHSEQLKSTSNTCLVEQDDSNVIPDSPDMCDNDIQNDQNVVECDDERVALANLIANLKLDVDENKKIQKQLKKANTTLPHELIERYGLGLILYRAPCAIKGVLRKNTENLNNKIIKLNEELSDCETDLYNYKRGLSQVEARLVEFKNNEIKFYERIIVLERDLELRDNKIENLRNELEGVKKEKESIDVKIKIFENSAKDLDCLLGTQRFVKDKTGLGLNEYTIMPPPPAQVYSPPKNDLSWTGLPEFVDDTVTDYSRPTPSIDVSKDVSDEQKAIWKSNSASFSEQGGFITQGEGSENPTEPHHTPSAQDEPTPQHDQTTSQEPQQQETTIPSPSPSDIPIHRRLTKGTIRISQSKVPSPGADETASPSGDDRHGEAFPTATSLDAGQDRENIAKTSAMPHEASPRVTSLGGGEGSMQQQLTKLMDICTSLQRQHSLMEAKIQSQDLEITQLKTRIKTLEDNEKMREGFAQEDAPNTGGMDQGEDLVEKSTDKGSESTGEMANVLSTLEAANILASGGSKSVFTTASTGVSPAVATASGSFPTAAVFTTASVATPRVTRSSRGIIIEPSSPISVNITSISKKDKGKGIMTYPEKPSKEMVLDQMSAQLAKELEEEFALEDQRIREQAERDSEIVRIHAQQELDMMIVELDRSNEMVAKHLSEYEQAEAELSHNEKVELINELHKYQKDLSQIKKYQDQQSKLTTKTKRRKFYTSVLRSSVGWKAKEFKGMTFDQIEEKFFPVWEKIQEFVPMDSKLESERLKRPGIKLSEEELKKMMEIVPAEEVYIEALQVKCHIIDWEVYSEGQIKYWKIIRVGDHTKVYQLFEEMLRKFDREDLDKLWSLVKETFSTTDPTEDKEKMLWVELKRLYEPDPRDQLWALQKYMHDPLEWKLYDTCGVHHVSTGRGHEIFMLVEKDYPLTKGLTTVMLCTKLQSIFPLLVLCIRTARERFPLLKFFHCCLKDKDSTAEVFPLLRYSLGLILYRAPCAIKGFLRFLVIEGGDHGKESSGAVSFRLGFVVCVARGMAAAKAVIVFRNRTTRSSGIIYSEIRKGSSVRDQDIYESCSTNNEKVLKRMLPAYFDHMLSFDNTLITKFFGLHCVKLSGSSQKKVRFVIMGNVFCTEVPINRRFDLKGSSHGRIMDIPETEIDANATLKDLDLIFIFLMQKDWFKEFSR
ncbi:putative ribonuclease H-like domain-containing protein [Tanacetum coccineum]